MSKIDNLIKQYCPNGVEYKTIKEIAEIGTGSSNRVDANKDGLYPFFVRSKDVLKINDFEFDEEAIIIPGEGGIGDIFHYIKGKYALHQRAYRIHFFIKELNVKFAYYYMIAQFKSFIFSKAVNATVTSIRKPMIEKFKLPIPPLPVQEEIVRVLDTFTALEARKRQYEYYRNKLLTFDENTTGGGEIKFMQLGEVCKIQRGVRVVKSQLNDGGVYPVYQNSLTPLGFYTKTNCQSDTTFIIAAGAAGEIGYSTVKFWAADDCFYLVSSKQLNARYIYHALLNQQISIKSRVRKASIPRLARSIVEKLIIPVPPLDEQERIIAILDKFDSLVNDISEGLPAELNARRQQYEYYRNKLLTFEEAA